MGYDYIYDSSLKDNTLEKIAYAKELYDKQVMKAEREEYIKNVLLENYVNKVKAHRTRYDVIDIFGKAQKEVGNKLKKDRPHFETIKHFLMDDFLGNDKSFKLEHIISCGYENYAWRFEFRRNDKVCYIEIPIKRSLTSENLGYAHYGMITFGIQESEHYWRMLKGSYEIQEIAGFIKDWADGKVKE